MYKLVPQTSKPHSLLLTFNYYYEPLIDADKSSVLYSERESHICGSACLFYHTANCLFCEGSKSPLIGPHMQHVLMSLQL